MQRRDLLRLGARALLAAPAAALAVPAAGYLLVPPPASDRPLSRLKLAPVSALAEGVSRVEYETVRVDGRRQARFAWVRRKGETLTVFSPVCPHAGCLVNWEAGAAKFICPCHQSEFAADGAWISGPSLDNLRSLKSEVSDGDLWIFVSE
jgi:Rieske Fe-S protein